MLQVYSILYTNSSLNTFKIWYVIAGLLFGEYWQRFQYTELSSKLLGYVTCALYLPIPRITYQLACFASLKVLFHRM